MLSAPEIKGEKPTKQASADRVFQSSYVDQESARECLTPLTPASRLIRLTICSSKRIPFAVFNLTFFAGSLCVPQVPWSSIPRGLLLQLQEAHGKCCSLV